MPDSLQPHSFRGNNNRFILYASTVQANQAIVFASNDTNTLTVFIAWLKLDLGIETWPVSMMAWMSTQRPG